MVLFNTEFWGNKADGLHIKLMKTHILNGKIKQNVVGAIHLDGRLTE